MAVPPSFTWTENRHTDIYPAIDPSKTDLTQPGKKVLITGSGRGIGRSTALAYAECGVDAIIIGARTSKELDEVEEAIRKINPKTRVLKLNLDLGDPSSIKAAAELVRREEGFINVLINNGGFSADWVPIAAGDEEEWWKVWEVNIRGTYLMTKSFIPLLLEGKQKGESGSHIINTSSTGAEFIVPGSSAYALSKFTISRLNEFMQVELEAQGLNCVSIHPGAIYTEMSKDNEFVKPMLVDSLKLPGGFTVWLTKEARPWLGGRYVHANWDVHELEKKKDRIVEEDLLKWKLGL